MSDKWLTKISDKDWKARCDKAMKQGHFSDVFIANEYRKILKAEKRKIWGMALVGVICVMVLIITALQS